MLGEQNKETFRRVIEEGFNKGNLDALDACYPPTYTEHQFDMPSTLEGLKGSIRFLRETFAPFSLTIKDMAAEGDKVWGRLIEHGTDSKGRARSLSSDGAAWAAPTIVRTDRVIRRHL